MKPKIVSVALLNQSESFYPIPYEDGKQISIGFGSRIT